MSVFDTTKTTSTTLPEWFNTAQQDAVNSAKAAMSGTTDFSNTATASAAKNLFGENNPWMTSINTLNEVATGAAHPWNADGTPNTQTALGGLFAAQNAKLENILPGVTAKEGAMGIGGGNFGSLRGQTATNTARAGALTTLAEQQNQAALNAQTQAVNAAIGAGNVGSQYGTTAANTTKQQLEGNLPAMTTYANILNQIGGALPKTATETTSGSQYDNALKAAGILFGTGGADKSTIDAITKFAGGGLDWLKNILNTGPEQLGGPTE